MSSEYRLNRSSYFSTTLNIKRASKFIIETMTITKALAIITANANTTNGSYLYFLHERSYFDEKSFWELYNAIRFAGQAYSHEKMLDRELTHQVLKTYHWHLLQIGFHFDEKDVYRVTNLPKNYSLYSMRLNAAVESYFKGKPITDEIEDLLNSELANGSKNESLY